MRIERHLVGEEALHAARTDFPERIGRDVAMMARDPMPAYGWHLVAESFLDYLGARSADGPDLDGQDTATALESAARAALGALRLTHRPDAACEVFIDYVGTGTRHGQDPGPAPGPLDGPEAVAAVAAVEAPAGDTKVTTHDWLDAFHLAFVAQVADEEAALLVAAAPPLPGNEDQPDVVLVHALLAHVYGWTQGSRSAVSRPLSGIARREVLDMLAAGLAPGTDWAGYRAALTTLRALAAGDEDGFAGALTEQLLLHRGDNHSETSGSRMPRSLLPLDALALAAMAVREEGWCRWQDLVVSDYLPRSVLEGFRTAAARVAAYGCRKRPDAVAALERGPLEVDGPSERLARHAGPAAHGDPSTAPTAPTDPTAQAADDPYLERFTDPRTPAHEAGAALRGVLATQGGRFLDALAAGRTGPEVREPLRLAAEAGAGHFRLLRLVAGERAEVRLGGHLRTLPAPKGEGGVRAAEWRRAMALALVLGAREPIADCVLLPPALLREPGPLTPENAWCLALHDYLRGAEAEPAVDRALVLCSPAADASYLPPPVVLLSQLVEGDRQGFALALADALEEFRDHAAGAPAGDTPEVLDLDALGLACHARRIGWPVPVVSPYLPAELLGRGVRNS